MKSEFRIVQHGECDFRPERRGWLWGWNPETTIISGSTCPLAFHTQQQAQAYVALRTREIDEENKKRSFKRRVVPMKLGDTPRTDQLVDSWALSVNDYERLNRMHEHAKQLEMELAARSPLNPGDYCGWCNRRVP